MLLLWLRINQVSSWDVAVQVLVLVGDADNENLRAQLILIRLGWKRRIEPRTTLDAWWKSKFVESFVEALLLNIMLELLTLHKVWVVLLGCFEVRLHIVLFKLVLNIFDHFLEAELSALNSAPHRIKLFRALKSYYRFKKRKEVNSLKLVVLAF